MAETKGMLQDGAQEMEFDIHKYLQLVMRRKWLILGFTALLALAVAIGTDYQPRIYEARTSVLAGNEAPRLLNFSDPLPQDRFGDQTYLQTQGAILTNDRRGIEIGEKVAGQWKYHTLDLKPGMLR